MSDLKITKSDKFELAKESVMSKLKDKGIILSDKSEVDNDHLKNKTLKELQKHYCDLLDPSKLPEVDYSGLQFGVFTSGGTDGDMSKIPKKSIIARLLCSHPKTAMRQYSTGGGFMADVYEYDICMVCGGTVSKKQVW